MGKERYKQIKRTKEEIARNEAFDEAKRRQLYPEGIEKDGEIKKVQIKPEINSDHPVG